jgi:hypothetical protein
VIASFLNSLAAQVRALVSSGKAVHVTEETARELELIAGLFEPVSYAAEIVNSQLAVDIEREVTPADIALGFLLASRAPVELCGSADGDYYRADSDGIQRAAECAELAVYGGLLWGPGTRINGEAALSNPSTGTREGARAAWDFVVSGTLAGEAMASSGLLFDTSTNRPLSTEKCRDIARQMADIRAKYRRELEGMK